MQKTLLLIMAVLLVGCITVEGGKDFSAVSLGMTKQQVLEARGKLYETAAKSGIEYFIYASFKGRSTHTGNWETSIPLKTLRSS